MGKKKILMRDYKFSDGFLKQKADDIKGSVQRDSAEFATRGVNAATITAFETSISSFDNTQTDEELEAIVTSSTASKNALASELKTDIRTVRTIAQNKLGVNDGLYRAFGFDDMDDMPDEQLYRLGKRVIREATAQLANLASKGLTPAMITTLTTVNTNFDNAIDAQESAIKNRDIKTQERIEKGNAVYQEIVELCNTGKDLWATTDEAKYNDYVIYDTPSGEPETPPTP
jgi:hypothetical protein